MQKESTEDFTIYTKEDYTNFVTEYADRATGIVANLLKHDSTLYISNVKTDVVAIAIDNHVIPISINKKEYKNAIICSPYATYVKSPLDELSKFDRLWMKSFLIIHSVVMSMLCRVTKINQIAQVNNNLNSLLKHPQQMHQLLTRLTSILTQKYPHHAITFFRVNDKLDVNLLQSLRDHGYILFPDRAAHIFFPDNQFMKRSHTKRDISLLRKTDHQIVTHDELTEADAARIAELYHLLFVDKHSKFNPKYTTEYFRQAICNHWHHYSALRNPDGRIDAFISWFKRENTMMCGPLGYDTSIDPKVGLYRMLVALCLKHANEHQLIFNMGAGSGQFKANRGSQESLEYTAVYCKHLPFYRHIPWRILSLACNKLLHKVIQSSTI